MIDGRLVWEPGPLGPTTICPQDIVPTEQCGVAARAGDDSTFALTAAAINIQGLRGKFKHVEDQLDGLGIQLVMLQETRLRRGSARPTKRPALALCDSASRMGRCGHSSSEIARSSRSTASAWSGRNCEQLMNHTASRMQFRCAFGIAIEAWLKDCLLRVKFCNEAVVSVSKPTAHVLL